MIIDWPFQTNKQQGIHKQQLICIINTKSKGSQRDIRTLLIPILDPTSLPYVCFFPSTHSPKTASSGSDGVPPKIFASSESIDAIHVLEYDPGKSISTLSIILPKRGKRRISGDRRGVDNDDGPLTTSFEKQRENGVLIIEVQQWLIRQSKLHDQPTGPRLTLREDRRNSSDRV